MRQVRLFRLFLCCFLISICQLSLAGERASTDGEKAMVPVVHKQGKYAGRAGNNTALNSDQKQNLNAQNQSGKNEMQEGKPLTKEEKRALRRQVNESVRTYPRQNHAGTT